MGYAICGKAFPARRTERIGRTQDQRHHPGKVRARQLVALAVPALIQEQEPQAEKGRAKKNSWMGALVPGKKDGGEERRWTTGHAAAQRASGVGECRPSKGQQTACTAAICRL